MLTASERGRIKMQHERPDFPTMEQVEKANHEQLARWYRFLPSGDTKADSGRSWTGLRSDSKG
jgi:hypothetical protein